MSASFEITGWVLEFEGAKNSPCRSNNDGRKRYFQLLSKIVTTFYSFLSLWLKKGFMISMGTGKIVVELFSTAISLKVWRYRNVRALGCSLNIFAASANLWEAWNSPSAAITLLRLSRSASA